MGKGNRTRNVSAPKKDGGSSIYSTLVKIGAIALAALFVVILVFGVLHTTGILQRSVTAVSVGGSKLSALDFNIYYCDIRSNFLDQYGAMLESYGYDFSAGFESQLSMFGDGEQTWKDYFNQEAIANATQVLTLYQEGKAAGHVMTDYYQQSLADNMENLNYTAEYFGMTVDGYLNSPYAYGNGTKLQDLERVYEMKFYASSYAQAMIDSYEYSEADIEANYLENKDTYDVADYYKYTLSYETFSYTEPAEGESVPEGEPQSADEATRMTEESREAARAEAEAFLARVSAGEDFDAVAREYFDADEAAHTHEEGEEHEFESSLSEGNTLTATGTVAEWAKNAERAEGDTEMLEDGSSYVIVKFVSRYRKEVPTATVRHILFQTTTPEEGASEEDIAKIEMENDIKRSTAYAVYDEWKNGDATEESFAELAKEYSADGNAAEGGIYEHFEQGAMVASFDEWCFEPARQYGDHGIVPTDFGIHLMYFVSHDRPAYYYTIENLLKNEAYNAYYEGATGNYPVSSSKIAMALCF